MKIPSNYDKYENKVSKHEVTRKKITPKNDYSEEESLFEATKQKFKNQSEPDFEPNYPGIEFDELPNGISRYKYNDSEITIYKKDDEYKSEYYGPKGGNYAEDFEDKYEPEEIKVDSKTENNSLGINGKIDEKFIQGATGDCWLLVGLNSLGSTEEGKKTIQDSIKVNDDNSVTITFKGVGVSYTMPAQEIIDHDTDDNLSDEYSNGDNDILAFELATQKLLDDINSGRVQLDTNNVNITNISQNIGDGGLPSQMIYFLTGTEAQEYSNYNNGEMQNIDPNQIYEILNNAYQSGDTAMTFGIYYGAHTGALQNGMEYSLDVGNGGHALSVTNITADTVTFINPWDNSQEYTMSYEEFANLGIGYISTANTNNNNTKKEITDMTDYEHPYVSNGSTEKGSSSDNRKKYDKTNDKTSDISENKDKATNDKDLDLDSDENKGTSHNSDTKDFDFDFIEDAKLTKRKKAKSNKNSTSTFGRLREFFRSLYQQFEIDKKPQTNN